jgi:hypothetical protein
MNDRPKRPRVRYNSTMRVPRLLCLITGSHRLVAVMVRLVDGSVRNVVRCATCGAAY